MPRHPAARMDPNGRDLPIPDPHPGVFVDPFTLYAERGESVDESVLELPQIPVEVLAMLLEVEDRITHELARAMEGDVAAALDLEQLDATRGQQGGVGEQ